MDSESIKLYHYDEKKLRQQNADIGQTDFLVAEIKSLRQETLSASDKQKLVQENKVEYNRSQRTNLTSLLDKTCPEKKPKTPLDKDRANAVVNISQIKVPEIRKFSQPFKKKQPYDKKSTISELKNNFVWTSWPDWWLWLAIKF